MDVNHEERARERLRHATQTKDTANGQQPFGKSKQRQGSDEEFCKNADAADLVSEAIKDADDECIEASSGKSVVDDIRPMNGGTPRKDNEGNRRTREENSERRQAPHANDEYLRRPFCEDPDQRIERVRSKDEGVRESGNQWKAGSYAESTNSESSARAISDRCYDYVTRTDDLSPRGSRQPYHRNTENGSTAALSNRLDAGKLGTFSRRAGGIRNSWEHGRSHGKSSTSASDTKYYTTLRTRDEEGRIKCDNPSLRAAPSRTSGLFSSLFCFMSSRFIYESDPFEGALRQCPKVTLNVVERATTPVSIEISFGNPQKQILPSYYYMNTDKSGPISRRAPSGAGSRTSRCNSAQSAAVADRSLPPLDSPLNESRHELGVLIPEEDERGSRQGRDTRTTKSAKSGGRPSLHPTPQPRRSSATKRPVTSSSSATTRSLGLPGKPMKSNYIR